MSPNYFLKTAKKLLAVKTSTKYKNLSLFEYPFDDKLLSLSSLYRSSRRFYLDLGGQYFPRICSTMRGLSAQDLFQDKIDYSPSASQLEWFCENPADVLDPEKEIESLMRYNEISVYHEQNHRVIWRLLPPAPLERDDLRRYLNFAESLVVILDLALGDQLGPKQSEMFEDMRVIYRSGSHRAFAKSGKKKYRDYLLSLFVATYFLLETIHTDDILPALNYMFPGNNVMNKAAVGRSLQLSELFTRVTNPQWQERYWQHAGRSLKKLHALSKEEPLYLSEDPVDIVDDLYLVRRVLDHYGL
jgi:hypothetical protein